MYRVLLLVLSTIMTLVVPATALAAPNIIVPESGNAQFVYVVNMDFTYGIIGICVVNAMLLGLIWLQLGAIRAAAERQSPPPK